MSIVVKTINIEEIILINKKITELKLEVDAKRGKYIVDANSLMGLLSLDFSDGVEFMIHDSNDKESVNNFINFLRTYIK